MPRKPKPPVEWPALPYQEWAATKKTLQMYTQMAGKVRLALAPSQPEWLASCLYVTTRGLTTGRMPYDDLAVELVFDFYDHTLSVLVSDGRVRAIPLGPARTVAAFYRHLMDAFADLGLKVDIWSKPQELDDTTPFEENEHDCSYDADQVLRWFTVLGAVHNVFDEWRSRFFGRTGLQFWWGAFDLGVLRFTGRHVEAPEDRGYIMRYDLDAEFMNAGFWSGDDKRPAPVFYAYLHPQPPGCELASIDPSSAAWVETMGEWILPYEEVRTSEDPRKTLMGFLDCVYGLAGELGGWDLLDFEYTKPKKPKRPKPEE
jgi:hypothetical protein